MLVSKMSLLEKVGRVIGGGVCFCADKLEYFPKKLEEYLYQRSKNAKSEAERKTFEILGAIATFIHIGAMGLVIMVLCAASIIGLSLILPVWLAALITAAMVAICTLSYIFFGDKVEELKTESEAASKFAAAGATA